MKSCEQRGRDLLNQNVITAAGLAEWLRGAKEGGHHETVSLGLPSYSLLCTVLQSIRAGSGGLVLGSFEVNQHNRPQDRLLDWFFHPVLVLKEQIQALRMTEEEVRFLEKLTVFAGNVAGAGAAGWENGAGMMVVPQDPVRLAQIQAISRRHVCCSVHLLFMTCVWCGVSPCSEWCCLSGRLVGIVRSLSKFPTYRRRYRHVVKLLIAYSVERESSGRSSASGRSASYFEITQLDV